MRPNSTNTRAALGAVVIHLVIVAVFLLLPPPFPSGGKKTTKEELTYVQLKEETPASEEAPGPTVDEEGVSITHPAPEGKSAKTRMAFKGGRVTSSGGVNKGNAGGAGKGVNTAPEVNGHPAVAAQQTSRPKSENNAPHPEAAPATNRPPVNQPPPLTSPPFKIATPAATPPPASKNTANVQPPSTGTTTITSEAKSGEKVAGTVRVDRDSVGFKYVKGWPAPGGVRVKVATSGQSGAVAWRAKADDRWVILSPARGLGAGAVEVGVDVTGLLLGFHPATVTVAPEASGAWVASFDVSVMVLPKQAGPPELPHSSYDAYMETGCKVCHLPAGMFPTEDYMQRPEFCGLCHAPGRMAADRVIKGGHPTLVAVGSGGTKKPSAGTVDSGVDSDRMATHLMEGGLITCVTCHNVMKKSDPYGRSWEPASTRDGLRFELLMGGWSRMGLPTVRVYVTDSLIPRPKRLKDAYGYLADPGSYSVDPASGAVVFKRAVPKGSYVFVTLTDPYLRQTVRDDRLCTDCHNQPSHAGLSCLTCHQAHGGGAKCVRRSVATPDGARGVSYRSRKDSGVKGGLCLSCHPTAHNQGKDCLTCHTHSAGFTS